MKLIEIKKDEHYIVVDDSEIKGKDYVYDTEAKYIRQLIHKHNETDFDVKITHSTQPLKGIVWNNIIPLSLSEVEEAIYGYSVEKMASLHKVNISDDWSKASYIKGYNTHKELVKDKFVLTKDEVSKIIEMARTLIEGNYEFEVENILGSSEGTYGIRQKYCEEEIIQSLLPKTEWEVNFDEQGKIKLI